MLEVHYSASCSCGLLLLLHLFFFISPLLFCLLPCLLERTVSSHYGVLLLSLSQPRWLSTCPPPALTSEVWSTYVPPVSPPSSPQEGKKASKEQKTVQKKTKTVQEARQAGRQAILRRKRSKNTQTKRKKEKKEGKQKEKETQIEKKMGDEARTRLTSWRIAPVFRQGGLVGPDSLSKKEQPSRCRGRAEWTDGKDSSRARDPSPGSYCTYIPPCDIYRLPYYISILTYGYTQLRLHKECYITILRTLLFFQAWGKRALCMAVNAGYAARSSACLYLDAVRYFSCLMLHASAAAGCCWFAGGTNRDALDQRGLPPGCNANQIQSSVVFTHFYLFCLLSFSLTFTRSRRLFVRSYRTAIWRKYGTGNVAREVSPLPSQVSF
ncbi:hypothetical protein TRV_00791 [Trichophyton verrucosum HKI 0517]|uniref:Uncharacterized protein n=1 Tax=Trichophyton verrucosum (strain HKI 0517) TaxID=663202 RepID=D4D144_TRIVH|nr:uncharacterized protein TRV_00791 [Trichophyton verrucosum HKI 0517]EFE44442.1 hypothetical protein TRV_00791 [Trichophyton verrucosum HKI 0517]